MVTAVARSDGLDTTSSCVVPVAVAGSMNDWLSDGTTQVAAATPRRSPSVAQDATLPAAPVPSSEAVRRVSNRVGPSSTAPERTAMASASSPSDRRSASASASAIGVTEDM